jgi:hypothetical protein
LTIDPLLIIVIVARHCIALSPLNCNISGNDELLPVEGGVVDPGPGAGLRQVDELTPVELQRLCGCKEIY